jgi:hypothetical protein
VYSGHLAEPAAKRSTIYLLAAVNWHATAMFFSGVFFRLPEFMARSFHAHGMRDLIKNHKIP